MAKFTRLGEPMNLDAIPALIRDYHGAGFHDMALEWDAFYTECTQIEVMRDALKITEPTYVESPVPDGTYWEVI